jgi:hypothetical protein
MSSGNNRLNFLIPYCSTRRTDTFLRGPQLRYYKRKPVPLVLAKPKPKSKPKTIKIKK